MRRLATAPAFLLALAVVASTAIPAHSAPSHLAQHTTSSGDARVSAATISLDAASSALGAKFVNVSWNWIRHATGYRVQLSRTKDFSSVVATRNPRNDDRRPPGGRQATVVGQLHDATYYWARVRKVKGSTQSAWTEPVRVATKAHMPDPITAVHDHRGPTPGETTITWASDGGHTDFYKVVTSLTPWSAGRPGRHATAFQAPGSTRSLTLTPGQTAQAGARLGSGRHLFYRVTAVRKGEADTATRPYAHTNTTTVAGEGPRMSGAQLQIAQYNVHLATADVAGHRWADRAKPVSRNLASVAPALVSLQELVPGMWTKDDGGPGLANALQQVGMGRYELTRATGYGNGTPGDSRILYDPNQVKMVSTCDDQKVSCVISLPVPEGSHYAPYARFRELGSGQEFWFVSVHLSHGNDAKTGDLRGRQTQALVEGIKQLNSDGLPVIVGGDFNSSQTAKGSDQPNRVMVAAGYYNTSAAARQVNLRYNTVNGYVSPEKPSNWGFGSCYDQVWTLNMPGAATFAQVLRSSPYPSDHNLVYTDLRLP
jgi:endonuclease/exonuclease/phosphatase family metal-dependent hydrolase